MACVVVAEDELHILHLVGLWLRQNGHQVFEVRNGQAALQAVREHHPQALITDVNMPGMDGLALVERVLADEHRPRAVIVLSSRCNLPDWESCDSGSVVLRHPKPFSPTRLLADLESALGGEVIVQAGSACQGPQHAGDHP